MNLLRKADTGSLHVQRAHSRAAMGEQAATDVAAHLRRLLADQPHVRMIFAAAPSQSEMLDVLVRAEGIDWSRVTAFHMDEYIGLDPAAPQRFGLWLRRALFDHLPFAAVHLLDPGADPAQAARDYAALLAQAPIDIVCLGIGANGHLAFNDPPADLYDPLDVRVVALDAVCRQQQVDDGCFAGFADVPTHALTLTVPRLLRAGALFCVVPGALKRDAVIATLHGPIDGTCPGSALRLHRNCTLYLDPDSAPDGLDGQAGHGLCASYLDQCEQLMRRLHDTQGPAMDAAARHLAAAVEADRLVHVYGPGGHAAMATEEIFYRAGGLMHVSPILDPGTLLAHGALRSTAMERLPGYGRVVIEQAGVRQGDVLLLVSAFGINTAVIDAALAARDKGVFVIGLNGWATARGIPADHPARHPSGANLQDLADLAIDTGIPDGDAILRIAGVDNPVGPVSTFANVFALNALMLRTTALLAERGVTPPVWLSRNAAAGDRNDAALVETMRHRVPCL